MSILAAIARWTVRHRRLAVAALVLVFLVFVPFMPYAPQCRGGTLFDSVDIHIAEPYRSNLTERLEHFAVPYVRIGDLVMLRFWDWFADPESWVVNASNKAVYALIDKEFGGPTDGVPAHVLAMAARYTEPGGLFPELRCDLVRAVANEGW